MTSDARWDVREEGIWYKVAARATCPRCGARFQEESQRRKAAGPPEQPPLHVQVNDDGSVDLVAAGLFVPVVTHRCD